MEPNLLALLTESQRAFVLGAAADGTGGLAAELALALVGGARRAIRDRYREEPQRVALREAVAEALAAALHLWTLSEEDAAHHFGLFATWVKNDEVIQEFRQFLAPTDSLRLDVDLLREVFEDEGLDAGTLLTVSFEELVQDMVGAFYEAAARKPDLQGVLEVGLLRQVVERLGALATLEVLTARLAAQGQRTVNLLAEIRTLDAAIRDGQGDVIGLLEKILQALTKAQGEGRAEMLLAYEATQHALSGAGVQVEAVGQESRKRLLLLLTTRFDGTGLRALWFALNISVERLGGDNDHDRIISMLRYLEQHGRLAELIAWGRENRQDIEWPPLVEVTDQPASGAQGEMAQFLPPILTLLGEIYRRLSASSNPSEEELRELERPYRRRIGEMFEKLTFRGLSRRALVLPLEKIYVELKAVADVPEGADSYSADERRLFAEAEGRGLDESELRRQLDTLRLERWREASRARSERLTRRSISETLSDPTQRGVVILGDPGSGKTTLLHYLALQAARQPVGETLPIFVPLAAYDDFIRRQKQEAPLPLSDFLALYYERTQRLPGLGPLFARALHEGRALVLLDGLDEVLDPTTRQFVAQQASGLIREGSAAGNRFALTSRVVGYREAPLNAALPHVTVLDFGPDEIATFAHQWCHTYEEWVTGHVSEESVHRAEQEKAGLLDDVRSNSSVERLAANPLLLTMLALLRRQEGQKLPDRRVELYEKYVKALVDNWQQVRSEGARSEAPDRFDPHEAIEHLIELALWLQQHKPSGTTPLREMERALHDSCLRLLGHEEPERAPAKARLEATQQAAHFIHDMRHFAGLLAERGQDAFGFLHLTFQEYFAGRALARLEPEARWAILRGVLHLPRWREPLLLCAGQLGILEHRRDQVSDLAQRVLEAGSDHEELLHRDLFLAAAIAADDVGLTPALLDRLCDQLIPLQQSSIPTLRDSALNALARLARIGHAPAIAALHESLKHKTLWYYTMQALKPALTDERCGTLRDALLQTLADSFPNVRAMAVRALAGLASSHPLTRDALLRALQDSAGGVRAAAVEALAGLASSHAPTHDALLSTLQDGEGYVQATAVEAVAGLASSHPPTDAALLRALQDSDYGVRAAAVRALAGLASSHPPTHATLLRALQDSEYRVREAAVQALAGLASSHTPTHDALLQALRDSDMFVRVAAVRALAPLAASEPATHHTLLSALQDSERYVRAAVVEALAGMASSHAPTHHALLRALQDSDGGVRAAVVQALAGLARSHPVTHSARFLALRDTTYPMRAAAVRALAGLASSHPPTHAALLRALQDSDYGVREAAVQALAGLASSHTPTHNALLRALQDSDMFVRVAVVEALAGLAGSHPPTHHALLLALQDKADRVRAATVRALAGLASSHPPTDAALLRALQDSDYGVRAAAVRALAGLASSHPPTHAALLRALQDSEYRVRAAAVQALAGLASSHTPTHDALLRALQDSDGGVRAAAVRALAPLAASEPATHHALLSVLHDSDADVEAAVVEALAGLASRHPPTYDALLLALQASWYPERVAAVRALARLASRHPPTYDALLLTLQASWYPVQAAVVGALARLASRHPPTYDALLLTLQDYPVRAAVVEALAGLASSPPPYDALLRALQDNDDHVRAAVVEALAGLASSPAPTHDALLRALQDKADRVRAAAVRALAGQIGVEAGTTLLLVPWLGFVVENDYRNKGERVRRLLAERYAPLLIEDKALRAQVIAMLDSSAWATRQGAAMVLIAMPGGPPPEVLPKLTGLLDDLRGEESWPGRLTIAALFVNDRDAALSQEAIAAAVGALDYATQPWVYMPSLGQHVRSQAAQILGTLEPLYRDDAIFARLARVLDEDENEAVRDAAFGALLRLAAAPERGTAEGETRRGGEGEKRQRPIPPLFP